MDASASSTAQAEIRLERSEDDKAVAALIAAAFGPGRYAKAVERLREGRAVPLGLNYVGLDGDRLVGCVQLWPIHIGETPALLLGPIAVDGVFRSRGLGAALVERCCKAAADDGHGIILLVGDAPFFSRMGFEPASQGVVMPGPVDRRRLLWRPLRAGAVDGVEGIVRPG